MKNFYEFIRHMQLINMWIIKYAIQSLQSDGNIKEIEYGIDYLKKIRWGLLKDGWHNRDYFDATFDYSMQCHCVHVSILKEVAELVELEILENNFNTYFRFKICTES